MSLCLVNRTPSIKVELYKYDEDTLAAIRRAGFALYSESAIIDGVPTGQPLAEEFTRPDGLIAFNDLGSGRYYIYETTPPTGYLPISGPIVFSIRNQIPTLESAPNGVTMVKARAGNEVSPVDLRCPTNGLL